MLAKRWPRTEAWPPFSPFVSVHSLYYLSSQSITCLLSSAHVKTTVPSKANTLLASSAQVENRKKKSNQSKVGVSPHQFNFKFAIDTFLVLHNEMGKSPTVFRSIPYSPCFHCFFFALQLGTKSQEKTKAD